MSKTLLLLLTINYLFNPEQKHHTLGDNDININVNNMSSIHSIDSDTYSIDLSMLISNGALLLIDKPTIVTNTSNSIIDHIITNDNNNKLCPCISRSGLTDHFLVACFVANGSQNYDVSRNNEQQFSFVIRGVLIVTYF